MEEIILGFINNILDKNVLLAYVFFFVSSILQLVFPPYPADVVLIFEGYITTKSVLFSFVPILLNAMAGNFVGSYIVYKFGRFKGDSVFQYKFIKRFIDDKHRRKAEKLFDKYGSFAIGISKFVPGVNAIMILFSGIFKMKASIVYLSVLLSSVVHHTAVLLLGRFLGENIGYVKKILKTYNSVVISLMVVLLITGIAVYWYKKRKKQQKELAN